MNCNIGLVKWNVRTLRGSRCVLWKQRVVWEAADPVVVSITITVNTQIKSIP